MKKIITLSIMFSLSVLASEEEGTGTPSSSSAETAYQLVCTPVAANAYQPDSTVQCVMVEVPIEN